jgi:hypothetical protein
MNAALNIPAEIRPLLFSGCLFDLSQTVAEFSALFDRRGSTDHPEWFVEPFECFDRTRALLELLDWPRIDPPSEVRVDEFAHYEALRAAVRMELATQRNLRDTKENSPELRADAAEAAAALEAFLEDAGLEDDG